MNPQNKPVCKLSRHWLEFMQTLRKRYISVSHGEIFLAVLSHYMTSGRGTNVASIAASLEMPRSSAYRKLQELTKNGSLLRNSKLLYIPSSLALEEMIDLYGFQNSFNQEKNIKSPRHLYV